MEAEGILGFVSGRNRWVTPKASKSITSRLDSWFSCMGIGVRRPGVKRNIISGEKGCVLVQAPAKAREVWPDIIVVNGSSYYGETPRSPIYRSVDGKVLDLSISS